MDQFRPLPAPPEDFLGLTGVTHLATGGEPPLLRRHQDAFAAFAADKARGHSGYFAHWDVTAEARAAVARLTGMTAGDVALLGNASDGIARVAGAIDWRDGDNVVVPEQDYASGRFALGALAARGVEVRVVPSRDWLFTADDILARCDGRTRLLYVSQITSFTGQHMDVAALSDGLPASTILMLDVSHALGVLPVPGHLCDVVVSACYKFVLGVHSGVLCWNRARRPDLAPAFAGWWSAERAGSAVAYRLKDTAERWEYGNAPHLSNYILKASIDYLEAFGIDNIARHVRRLGGVLRAGLMELGLSDPGLEVITPEAPGDRGPNICFAHPDHRRIMARLRQDDILVWSDGGRVRASLHLFSTEADVARYLDRLPQALSG